METTLTSQQLDDIVAKVNTSRVAVPLLRLKTTKINGTVSHKTLCNNGHAHRGVFLQGRISWWEVELQLGLTKTMINNARH